MITFIVQKTDLLNGQVTRIPFFDLALARNFVNNRSFLMHLTGMVYDYKIKLLGYER